MRFDPRNVVELLLRLEQQGMAFRPLTAEIAAALSKGDFQLALEISGRLHSVLESIVATKALIREHVLEADGLGEPGESLGELAIRARTMVILMELGRLRDALRDEPLRAPTAGWFVGRFQDIDDVIAFFREGLDRINRIWRPYRQDQPLVPTRARRGGSTRARLGGWFALGADRNAQTAVPMAEPSGDGRSVPVFS